MSALIDEINETSLPKKKELYINLAMESITDSNYKHTKRVWKHFGIKNVGQYHDLYLQSDTLLLADVFESF